MKIDEWRMMASLREIFFKQTEYIYSTFDVRRSSVSFSIKPAVFLAGAAAYMKLRLIWLLRWSGFNSELQNIFFFVPSGLSG